MSNNTKINDYKDFCKELKGLINYGECIYNLKNILRNKEEKNENFFLVDMDYIVEWKNKSGYNILKDYIKNYLDDKEDIKNKIILQEIWSNNSTSIKEKNKMGDMKIDKVYNIKSSNIELNTNFGFLPMQIYNVFEKKIKQLIQKEGIFKGGKLLIQLENEHYYCIFLKNKNQIREVILTIPAQTGNIIQKKIYDEILNADINLLSKSFEFKDSEKKEIFLNLDDGIRYSYYAQPKKFEENIFKKIFGEKEVITRDKLKEKNEKFKNELKETFKDKDLNNLEEWEKLVSYSTKNIFKKKCNKVKLPNDNNLKIGIKAHKFISPKCQKQLNIFDYSTKNKITIEDKPKNDELINKSNDKNEKDEKKEIEKIKKDEKPKESHTEKDIEDIKLSSDNFINNDNNKENNDYNDLNKNGKPIITNNAKDKNSKIENATPKSDKEKKLIIEKNISNIIPSEEKKSENNLDINLGQSIKSNKSDNIKEKSIHDNNIVTNDNNNHTNLDNERKNLDNLNDNVDDEHIIEITDSQINYTNLRRMNKNQNRFQTISQESSKVDGDIKHKNNESSKNNKNTLPNESKYKKCNENRRISLPSDYDKSKIFLNKNILKQYIYFQNLESIKEIEEIKKKRKEIEKKNKKVLKRLLTLSKEKEKFDEERKIFLTSRDKIINKYRESEQKLKNLENELEKKFLDKKNAINDEKNKIMKKKIQLENQKKNLNELSKNKFNPINTSSEIINPKNKEDTISLNNDKQSNKNQEEKSEGIKYEESNNDNNNNILDSNNNNENEYPEIDEINNNKMVPNDIENIILEKKMLCNDMGDIKDNPYVQSNSNCIETINNNDNEDIIPGDSNSMKLSNMKNNNKEEDSNENEIDNLKGNLYIEEYNPSLGLQKIEEPKYFNALIQCFAHIKEITDEIINIGQNSIQPSSKNSLTKKYRELLINIFIPERIHNLNRQPYNANQFKQIIYDHNSSFKSNEYIEYEGFINYFIQQLHNELNLSKASSRINNQDNYSLEKFINSFNKQNKSIISDILYGINQSTLYCHKCQKTCYNYDSYNHLYFKISKVIEYKANKFNQDIANINLFDCMDYYQRPETLLGDKGLLCPSCSELTESTSIKYLYSSGIMLIFVLDWDLDNISFDFDKKINLTDYILKKGDGKKEKYFLSGIVNFENDDYGNGYFSAYCRMNKDGDWYCYDDDNVYIRDFDNIKKRGFPIVLFYHKI